jgi:hypothetical protein
VDLVACFPVVAWSPSEYRVFATRPARAQAEHALPAFPVESALAFDHDRDVQGWF